MQSSLLTTEPKASYRPRRYVPHLQDHGGERRALAALRATSPETLDGITPVLQLVGGVKRELSRTAIKGHVERIAGAVGSDITFYLDFLRADPNRLLPTRDGRSSVAELVYGYARACDLSFIPVTWTTSTRAHINATANEAVIGGRGLALRHRLMRNTGAAGSSTATILAKRLSDARFSPEDVDLLLDLEYIDPEVNLTVERVLRSLSKAESVGRWRRIVLTGSSIPRTMRCVPEDGELLLTRREWELWQSLPDEVRTRVDFGDYGIQHPLPPQRSGQGMRANIRYTLADGHFVVRGRGEVRVEGAGQYVTLCRRLIDSGHFAGSEYTWGDALIESCATGQSAPGNQNTWRAAGTAHHLKVVSEQVLLQL